MIPEEKIAELEKLALKNEAVAELLEFYRTVTESPYLNSYNTIYNQILDINSQLNIEDGQDGKIDIFTDKDDKSFDRAWKYMLDLKLLLENLDFIRKMISPDKQKQVAHKTKLNKKITDQVSI